MSKQTRSNIKLGLFVISSIVILAVALYLIGTNQNMFTSSFRLKARFKNVDGLMPGNNVRYAGIQTGTVKDVEIINDSTVEVTMYISKKSRHYLRKNSLVSIGNEGLMGNKVINIVPNPTPAPQVEEGDILQSAQTGINDAMSTLFKTNDNAALISTELLQTVQRLNNSPVLWRILSDTTLPVNLTASMADIRTSSSNIRAASAQLQQIVAGIKNGTGAAGVLLADTTAGRQLSNTVSNIYKASKQVNLLMDRLDSVSAALNYGFANSEGTVNLLLNDSALRGQLSRSMSNIESGTAAFSEDMEALKHNFLTKGYFKKKAKKK